MQRRLWDQLGCWLVPLAFLATLAVMAFGFLHSDILANIWDPATAYEIKLVVLGAIVVGALAVAAERIWRVRLEASLALAGMAVLICAFGAMPVLLLGLFLTSATFMGAWLFVGVPTSRIPHAVFITTFGVALYAIAFTLMGPLPINTIQLHSFLLFAPLVVSLASPKARMVLLMAGATALRRAARPPEHRTTIELTGFIALFAVVVLHVLLAALPERYWDAMVSHLYIPSYVSAHARWGFDANLYAWAFLPAAVDWVYTHFFLLNGELATRLYNCAALILLCATLHTILRRETSREAAIWVTALFASLPLAFIETSSLFIENSLTLWITAAAGVILAASLRPTGREAAMVLLLLAAASMAKLHGAVAAAVIGSVLVILMLRQSLPRLTLLRTLAVGLVAAAAGLFPYLYAWIKTGNPTFPFYNHIFKSPLFPISVFADTRWMGKFKWSLLYDITFASDRFGEVDAGALGLSILLLTPLAIAAVIARPGAKAWLCLGLAGAIWLPIAFQIQYLRYFFPIFPLLFVPAAVGAMILLEMRQTRVLVFATFAAAAAFNIYKLPTGGWILRSFDLRAVIDPAAWRNIELAQSPERVANRMINEAGGSSARVLYTGNPYGALLHGQALYTDWYNVKLSEEMATVTTPEQAEAVLTRENVTHVICTEGAKSKPGQEVMCNYVMAKYPPMAKLGAITVHNLQSIR